MIAEAAFALVGLLFLLAAIRTFTSSIYLSLFGNVSNEAVGGIVLGVFAASFLAILTARRFGPRRSIALAAAGLGAATIVATASRSGPLDIVLAAAAVVFGTWWLALLHSGRPAGRGSALPVALPCALVADLALRAAFRTVPAVDLPLPLALPLVLVGAVVFLLTGIAALVGERSWTSPGARGALGLIALPALLLVGETGGTNAAQVAAAAGLGLGPEASRSVPLGAVALGVGAAAAAFALARPVPRRLVAAAAIALGATLLWAHLPAASLAGGALLAGGLVVAASVLTAAAPRPAGSPWLAASALALGWILFVAGAFGYYAYYAYAPAVWALTALVAFAALVVPAAAAPPLRTRSALAVAAVAVLVPLAALALTPAPPQAAPQPIFRFMTYNVHQGFGEDNVPSLDELAGVIAREAPDVVILQEVVRGWMIDQQHDVLGTLAERLGMSYVFGPQIGDLYGNAVLSRLPMTEVRNVQFPKEAALRHQPRGAIVLRVAGVLLIATHLDHIAGASAVRLAQVHILLSAWDGATPAIIAGDLNALPESLEMRLLAEAGFGDLAAQAGADQPTFPAREPRSRVDYVWGVGVLASQAHTVRSTASDHRAVVVNVTPLARR